MKTADLLSERGKTHGNYDDDAFAAMSLTGVIDDTRKVEPTDVQSHALTMICFKIARIITGDPSFEDHWRDIAGYATLVADRCVGKEVAQSAHATGCADDCTHPSHRIVPRG